MNNSKIIKNYYNLDEVYNVNKSSHFESESESEIEKLRRIKNENITFEPFNNFLHNGSEKIVDMSNNYQMDISSNYHEDISLNISNFGFNDNSFDIDKNYKDLRNKIKDYEKKNVNIYDRIDDKGNLLMNNLDINPTITDGRVKDITESSYNRNNIYIVGNLLTAVILIIIVIKK